MARAIGNSNIRSLKIKSHCKHVSTGCTLPCKILMSENHHEAMPSVLVNYVTEKRTRQKETDVQQKKHGKVSLILTLWRLGLMDVLQSPFCHAGIHYQNQRLTERHSCAMKVFSVIAFFLEATADSWSCWVVGLVAIIHLSRRPRRYPKFTRMICHHSLIPTRTLNNNMRMIRNYARIRFKI